MGSLLPLYRQSLRPTLTPGMDTDMVDTVDIMAVLTDTATDTTEEKGLPMPSQKLMPKLSHGTTLVTTVTPTLTMDTDTHILITTLERDLLMLNQKPKANHGMVMDTVDMDTDIVLMDMDTVVITMDKPLYFVPPKLP